MTANLPEVARTAWTRLRDELQSILGDDLVAIWAFGSTIGADRPRRPADLDTHIILRRRPDAETAQRIDDACDAIAGEVGVEWDAWFIALDDARLAERPPHAFREGRRDTAWALHRAHWLAGRFVHIYGQQPAEIVASPTWPEIEVDLDRELEHIERHVAEGDTDPYEAAYAVLNGSRILHAIETHNVVLSKREAGIWALEHVPERWHPGIRAALRAYDEQATPDDLQLLAAEMGAYVATIKERLPRRDQVSGQGLPRWSGY
jgi:aminoglycoside adenylyltransferase-like protein